MKIDSRWTSVAVAIALVPALDVARSTATDDTAALSLRATIASLPADLSAVASAKAEASAKAGLPAEASAKAGAATAGALTITLSRWSTEGERVPLIEAFAASAALPPATPQPAAPTGPGGSAGRGRGRGAPPPPPSPLARLSTAIKAAPTLGFIWTDGVTGYSIKYAWRSPAFEDQERIVLVTDRRLDSHTTDWAPPAGAAADADFTVIEMRIDHRGAGEGKTSLTTGVAIDTATKTLALEGYAAAPVWLKVTR